MKLTHAAGGFAVAVVLSACAPLSADEDTGATSHDTSSVAPSPTGAPTETESPTPAEPSATPAADESLPTETDQSGKSETALAALALLAVKGRAPMTGYDRERFGQSWLDADRNGCDTRNDVLGDLLTAVALEPDGCVVATGRYDDPYTGGSIDYQYGDGTLIDIDHVVALGNSWATGAQGWDITKRAAFANDPLNLLPADASANRQKSDGDAATWLPAYKPFRCDYVARQVAVKQKYALWVTAPEKDAIARVLSGCPDQALTPDTWAAPIRVDHDITDPGPPADEPVDPPSTAPSSSPPEVPVYFENCDAARAAGGAPVRRGGPGYGSHLDRDGDGVGCE